MAQKTQEEIMADMIVLAAAQEAAAAAVASPNPAAAASVSAVSGALPVPGALTQDFSAAAMPDNTDTPRPVMEQTTPANPDPTNDATVGEAQGLMRMLGLQTGPVDDIQGPKTNAALAEYRQAHNIPDDASLNDVVASMREQVKTDPSVNARMMDALGAGPGSMDVDDAKAIQHVLNARGADLDVDGDVGPLTSAALNEYAGIETAVVQPEPTLQQDASHYDMPPAEAAPPSFSTYEMPPAQPPPPMVDVTNVAPAPQQASAPVSSGGGDMMMGGDPAPMPAPSLDQGAVQSYSQGTLTPSFEHSASHGGAYDPGGARVSAPNVHIGHGGIRVNSPGSGPDVSVSSNGGFRVNVGGIRIGFRPH